MTLQERIDSYGRAFPDRPPLQLVTEGVGKAKHDVIYGQWVIGNDYRNKTRYYGAYPAGYLDRVMALFPDYIEAYERSKPRRNEKGAMVIDGRGQSLCQPVHVFSGSLPAGDYLRVDINPDCNPDIVSSVYDLPERWGFNGKTDWRDEMRRRYFILADPPYSADDAEKYATPMVDRGRALSALAKVTHMGGHLVWLDTTWPMHRKDQWRTVGRITLVRSTNHRVRLVSIFERVAA